MSCCERARPGEGCGFGAICRLASWRLCWMSASGTKPELRQLRREERQQLIDSSPRIRCLGTDTKATRKPRSQEGEWLWTNWMRVHSRADGTPVVSVRRNAGRLRADWRVQFAWAWVTGRAAGLAAAEKAGIP